MLRHLKDTIRSLLRFAGWELTPSVPVAVRRQEEYAQQLRKSWSCLSKYDVRTVLDIGANEGQFANLIRGILPAAKIISFEPLQSCYDILLKKQKALAPFVVFHTALGCESGKAKINKSEFSPSSSLLPMGALHKQELPYTAASIEEEITVSVLDDLLSELDLEEPFLIKIDVQGFEEQVLRGAARTLPKAIAVVVEVSAQPMYEGEPRFDRIYEMMKSIGFDYCGNVDQWRSSKDGSILQFDCLFENRRLT